MKRLTVWLTALICAAAPAVTASAASTADGDTLLRRLDHTIAVRDSLCSERRLGIQSTLRRAETATGGDAELYGIYRDLYGLYLSYRVDSALWVAEKRLRCAINMADKAKIISASLNLAESYSSSADYYNTLQTLDTLDRSAMQQYHLKYLYNIYSSTYMRMAKADAIQSRRLLYDSKVRTYRDSLLEFYGDDTPEYYNIKSTQLADAGYWQQALELMLKCQERFGIDDNPRALGLMAKIYGQSGDRHLQKRYLALSAILDLQAGKKDYASLMELAKLLNEDHDHERAYRYIRCALEDASFCNARSRTAEILESVPIIDAAYNQAERDEKMRMRMLAAIIAVLTILLGVALFVTRHHLRKNKHIAAALDETNNRLAMTNERLTEANEVKERCITELFDAHGSYIERFVEYRKQVYRLMKTSQFDAASAMTKSTQFESDETRRLYAHFDTIFLSIYPRFIADYNDMVTPEARLDSESVALTPELRVLALMRLGITASSHIAKVLNYTPQTVYNYRSRLKSVLAIDYDTFMARLPRMGK